MVREVGREPACHFYPLPVVLILPGTPPSHMGCCTFFSKSGSLKVKRNLRTCSDRSLSMLLASMARPRNSSTSSSGFELSWAFLVSKEPQTQDRLTTRGRYHRGTAGSASVPRPTRGAGSTLIRGWEAESDTGPARSLSAYMRRKLPKSQKTAPTGCRSFTDPMGCSLTDSSVHGLLQARIMEWVAISFSRGSSQARD